MKAGDKSELVRVLSKSRILVSGDLDFNLLKEIDTEIIVSKSVSRSDPSGAPIVIDNRFAQELVVEIEREKVPVPIEVLGPTEYRPIAADVKPDFKIHNTDAERIDGSVSDFVSYFNDRLNRVKDILKSSSMGLLTDLESVNRFSAGRDVAIAGILTQKITTKNGNIMVTLEDQSGSVKVIFMNGSSDIAKELFLKASNLIDDEVVVVRGKFSHPFIMAREVVWPDIPIRGQKTSNEDVDIAFISDTHSGSKFFLEKNFSQMIRWLNGESDRHKDIAGKIKYLVVGGDLVDGIGIYPDQEKSLVVSDIYSEYRILFDIMKSIPDYIEVFLLTGNHDAVQRAEPQPILPKEFASELKGSNIHFVTNPCFLSLHGIDVLSYHGTSLDSIVRAVPRHELREAGEGDDRAPEEEAPLPHTRRQRDRAQRRGTTW